MKYTRDGSPISSGIPVSRRKKFGGHFSNFALKLGRIVDIIYPDDPRSINKQRIEYVISIGGHRYRSAVDLTDRGSIYDYSQKIRKVTEKSFEGSLDISNLDENTDGEWVYVLFLNGNSDYPIIVGAAHHPRRYAYKKHSKSEGKFDADEFNGVEIKVDKDSNYTVTQVGRKNPEGSIQNQEAVGTQFKVYGNGDIELTTQNQSYIKITKATKTIEIFAQDNKITFNSSGLKLVDKNGNEVEMKSGKVKVLTSGKVSIGDGSNELLSILDAVITALGTITVLTPVGPAAPISAAPQWASVTTQQTKLGNIKE